MKKLVVLILVLVSTARGTQHLTINGQEVDSIVLGLDESCTIEVVSDDTKGYTDLLQKKTVGFGSLTLVEIKPEAGSGASVLPGIHGGYYLTAVGSGLSAGVHFVFQFVADEAEENDILLVEEGTLPKVLDLIQITVTEPNSAGTVFTYQGRLNERSNPAEGIYDLEFNIYRSINADIPFGMVNKENITVNAGIFTVELDFGSEVFNGDARWLEIGVRAGDLADPNVYTMLSPRQEITSTPYAIYAANADRLDGMEASAFMEAGGIKQLVQDFVVASGESVTAGDVVSYLNGYVQKGNIPGDGITYGLETVFNSATTYNTSVAALSATKFVATYKDAGNSGYGTAVIGEVSGNTITYGTEYIFNSDTTTDISVAALSGNKFVVVYKDDGNSGHGTAVVGDVSGTIIGFGSEYVFNSISTSFISVAALSSSKFVVAYSDGGNSNYGTCNIGEVSGNIIGYGFAYVFNPGYATYTSLAILSPSKFAVAYRDYGNLGYGTACVGDVSGNTITFGSEYVFNPEDTYVSIAALTSDKFVAVYSNERDPYFGATIIGVVSGNIITFGTSYEFNQVRLTTNFSVAALSANKIAICYRSGQGSNRGTVVIGNVSGETITYGLKYIFNPSRSYNNIISALSGDKFVIVYTDEESSYYSTCIIGDVTYDDVVGIAKVSGSAGEIVPVIIGGISDVHSGLIPGLRYFSDPSGDLSTEGSEYRVGLAISATEMLLDSNKSNVDQFFGDMVFANNFRITEGSAFEGLILQNQWGREVLVVDEKGVLNINGLSFNNPATDKTCWMMFEDKQGLGLRNLQNGQVYDFVLQKEMQPMSKITTLILKKR